ncbi:MAG TPA: hypothetical protein ENG48_05830 [Candidatus Atribacteria bacterium]|nr:MAG: hypothetical protein DRZ76_02125 [Candidatus Nealsonbacteria bacterium]HDK26590.1 hypothetical protein [Candidatus Atribacteria bacterium]
MPTVRRYAGLSEEGSFNQSPPPEAVFHIEIASTTLDVPDNPNLIFEGGLHRGRKILRPGYYTPAGNIIYPIDIRSFAYFMKWALGEYVFTDGGEGTNTHEMYGKENNILPSICARIGKDGFGEHIFSGLTISSVEIVIENDYIMCTVDMVGAKDTKTTIKAIADLNLFNENLLSFVDASITFGASDYNCKIKSMTLNIANNPDVEAGKGIGSRYPCRIPVGARDVNFSGNLWFEDDTEYQKYWGSSGGVGDSGPTNEEIVITIDSGDDGSIELKLPKAVYSNLSAQPAGRGEIVQGFSGIALIDTVTLADEVTEVETELLVTIKNNNDDMDDDIPS